MIENFSEKNRQNGGEPETKVDIFLGRMENATDIPGRIQTS